jgi:hypothetical protein
MTDRALPKMRAVPALQVVHGRGRQTTQVSLRQGARRDTLVKWSSGLSWPSADALDLPPPIALPPLPLDLGVLLLILCWSLLHQP